MNLEIEYCEEDYFNTIDYLYSIIVKDNGTRELLTNLIVINVITSLEVMIERSLKQYIHKLNLINLKSVELCKNLKIEHSKKIINEIYNLLDHEHCGEKIEIKYNELNKVWSDEELIKLNIDHKFPKGKHGEVQINKLFKRFGIENICELILVESNVESMLDNEKKYIDIESHIATLTKKRNLAIHEGVPLYSSITMEMLNESIIYTKKIMSEIIKILNQKIYEYNNRKPQYYL